MPIYEFQCNDCHKSQELLLNIDETPECQYCGSTNMKKLLSRFGTPGLSNKAKNIAYKARAGVEIGASFEERREKSHSHGHSHCSGHDHSHDHGHGCNSDYAQKLIEKFDKEKGFG